MKKLLLSSIIFTFFFISCADQIVTTCEDESPNPGLRANFSSIQEFIITPNCALSGCHSGPNPDEGLDLSAGKSYDNLVNIASRQSSLLLVKPGSSSESWMIKKLDAENTSLMPPGSALSRAEIDTIKKWINTGAEND
jgi:hypothetical protein